MTVPEFQKRKREGKKLIVVTAYDALFARIVEEAGIDVILVGDSLGVVVLGSAAAAYALGLSTLGWALGLLVAGLALLAAATGLCAGCEVYRLGARVRGIRSHKLEHVEPADVGLSPAGEAVVQFTHPLCSACRELESRFRAEGRRVVTVDVSKRPELARKYGVALVPTAVAVSPSGTVLARLAG